MAAAVAPRAANGGRSPLGPGDRVGCIVRIERDLLKVLDQNGLERTLRPAEVLPQKRSREGTALDREENEIVKGSVVKARML